MLDTQQTGVNKGTMNLFIGPLAPTGVNKQAHMGGGKHIPRPEGTEQQREEADKVVWLFINFI